ncbi:hypothetical protein A0U93_10215 [Neoasaia chiangmaiensis]|uniref:Uncharacterized protein n=1 Tax=Neoasaia chiangmaiensis TaxID=320497 RepID=A0A1U9KRE3_9PROT|nr:hypothetical protein A0U93_10215 [Neoasaia chiangmaiensis]
MTIRSIAQAQILGFFSIRSQLSRTRKEIAVLKEQIANKDLEISTLQVRLKRVLDGRDIDGRFVRRGISRSEK